MILFILILGFFAGVWITLGTIEDSPGGVALGVLALAVATLLTGRLM